MHPAHQPPPTNHPGHASTAHRFTGILPVTTTSPRPAARAKGIIYTGRFVPAAEAREIGLVDKVVPHGEVYQATCDMAARYAAGPALALRAAMQTIDDSLDAALDVSLEIERLHFSGLFATEDRRAGMRSFIENGPGKATSTGRSP